MLAFGYVALKHRQNCGPSPCTRLSRALTVESEEVGLECPASVRSFKRLVQFSRKPLSSAAPLRNHPCTRPGIRWVRRTRPYSSISFGYLRHIVFRQRLARNE
jgi:hypothetical protein